MAAVTTSPRRLLRPLLREELRALPPVRAVWTRLARRAELSFWRRRMDAIGDGRREWTYTELFGLDHDWYRGKRVLDIGCGPRGSLDWATQATARVGLDPLAEEYLALGADAEAMDYVEGVAEAMPFQDASFDVVGSFNSLDHVEDVDRAVAEISRVLRPGGDFLLATDVAHRPRLMEPQTFGWDVTRRFASSFEVVDERRYADRGGFDLALRDAVPHDGDGPGVLVTRLRRR
jgi:SAM-dependent methyltransferase